MRSNVDPVADREAKISGALPTDLVRPLDWLGHNLSEPIQLERLADIAGVRPRTLETHFRTFLRTTPLGWVQPMRLARARQQLLQASAEATVTDVAAANGFSRLGRFAGEYRRTFGERPSVTIQRSRRPSAPCRSRDRRDGSPHVQRVPARFRRSTIPVRCRYRRSLSPSRTCSRLRIAEGSRRLVLGAARSARFWPGSRRRPASGVSTRGRGVSARARRCPDVST